LITIIRVLHEYCILFKQLTHSGKKNGRNNQQNKQ
jgi:hypothetical protein